MHMRFGELFHCYSARRGSCLAVAPNMPDLARSHLSACTHAPPLVMGGRARFMVEPVAGAGAPSTLRARGGALRSLSAAVRARPPSSSSPLASLPKIRMSPRLELQRRL